MIELPHQEQDNHYVEMYKPELEIKDETILDSKALKLPVRRTIKPSDDYTQHYMLYNGQKYYHMKVYDKEIDETNKAELDEYGINLTNTNKS